MVEINHKKQKKDGINWICGETCLEMIYDYYKVEYNSNDIWEHIKTPRPTDRGQFYARTYKLAYDSILRGLYATIYKAMDLSILEEIDRIAIPAILCVTQEKTQAGHFIVFTGIKNKLYYYCDPDKDKEFSYVNEFKMQKAWQENETKEVTGNILVVFDKTITKTENCPACNRHFPLVHKQLLPFTKGVVCPYCDSLVSI